MARKRIIDPEFWSDQEIGFWSFEARLFYIGLWNFADDEGRLKAHPSLLKSQIFPYELKIDIEKLKLIISDKIQWYEINDVKYGFIRNFLKHQRIDKATPSKLPPPPPLDEYYTRALGGLPPKISKVKISEDKLIEDNLSYVDFEKSTTTLWNSFCINYPSLSKITEVSEKRRAKLKKRFERESFRNFQAVLDAIAVQKFLMGDNKSNWKVSFDWLIENDTNYLKVLEFKYGKNASEDAGFSAKWRNDALK